MKTLKIALFVCFTLIAASAFAQTVPEVINYQGKLVDGTNLLNGTVPISFRLYDAPSGGMFPYCTDSNDVTVVDGLYSTYIGDNVTWGSLDNAMLQTQVWVEVVIGTNVLSPREQMVSVGFSRCAASMPASSVLSHMIKDGEIGNWHISSGTIGGDKLRTGTISNSVIAAGAITSDKIGTWAVSNVNLAFGSVSSSVIEDGGVGGLDIAAGVVRSNHINWAAMPAGLQDGDDGMAYTAGTGLVIVGSTIAVSNGGIGAVQLASGSVASNKIDWASMPAGLQDGDDTGAALASYAENGTFTPAPAAFGSDSIAMGRESAAHADHSVVSGGRNNIITNAADYSTIGGGYVNRVGSLANYSTVAGGTDNRIEDSGSWTTIGGGGANRLRNNAWYATIGGGYQNEINTNAQSATIAGGYGNQIGRESRNSAIAGGSQNRIYSSATNAFIGGGSGNTISNASSSAVIGGGAANTAIGANTTVGGGMRNTAIDSGATVSGGSNNTAGAILAIVGGGERNTAGSGWSTIGGGMRNAASGHFSTIGGGQDNYIGASASGSFIGGGATNRIELNSAHSVVAGGLANTIASNATSAVIGGGFDNEITSNAPYATIPGGHGAVADSYGQMAFANGCFSNRGDAQAGLYVLRRHTTNTVDYEAMDLYLDGSNEHIRVAANEDVAFDALVVGKWAGSGDLNIAYRIEGLLTWDGPFRQVIYLLTDISDPPSTEFRAGAVAATDNSGFTIYVVSRGNLRWVATVRTAEVTY